MLLTGGSGFFLGVSEELTDAAGVGWGSDLLILVAELFATKSFSLMPRLLLML